MAFAPARFLDVANDVRTGLFRDCLDSMTIKDPKAMPASPSAAPVAGGDPTERLAALTLWLSECRHDARRQWHDGTATRSDHPTQERLDRIARLDIDTLVQASSDAGFRRYFRVSLQPPAPVETAAALADECENGPGRDLADTGAPRLMSLIAMDAPPPEKSREFVDIAALLRAAGVHVPDILESDIPRGFMLLEDLGTTLYIDVLRHLQAEERMADAQTMMREALSTLLRWQQASRPEILPPYDEAFFRREMALFPEWYIGRHLGHALSAKERDALDQVFDLLAANALQQPAVFVHRDFMPRNLMVNAPSPTVLDFQDAVMGPITYDVVSLFRDAFISWDEAFELDGIAWYWGQSKAAGLPVHEDFSEYYRQLEWMGLQRHLKILGLFARLNYRDDKPRYLADAPRFIAYARRVAFRYRALAPLARLLDALEQRAPQVGYTF